MRSNKILTATALASLLIGSAAFAGTKEDFDTVSKAKHSLADAVSAAEKSRLRRSTPSNQQSRCWIQSGELR